MNTILQSIADWLKGMLADGIMNNLSGMFDAVNSQVADVAVQVGSTPAGFSPEVFGLVRNISETVIIPIAGMFLTFIACYELIQLIIEHNNLANFDTWIFFKWIFKTFVAVMLITNTFNIVMAVFDVAQHGKLMEIPCLDHVIVGGGFGSMLSFKESQILDFTEKTINMTAEQIMAVSESSTEYNGEDAGKGANDMAENMMNNVPDFVREAEEWAARDGDGQNPGKREEVTLKFGKGLAEPFTSKDGKDYMRILIPNADKGDSTPWASFVLPAKAVHENQYGKGLWAKIPADGTTTISRPTLKGKDENGKNIWQNVRIEVANSDLKAMMESYKTRVPQEKETKPRESTREKLSALTKETAEKVSPAKAKNKAKSKEAAL